MSSTANGYLLLITPYSISKFSYLNGVSSGHKRYTGDPTVAFLVLDIVMDGITKELFVSHH